MANTSRPEAHVAFIAAAVVLLALPLLVAFGLAGLALLTQVGVMSGLGAGRIGDTDWIVWVLFAAWIVLVVAVVLAFAVRFIRRSA